MTEQNNVLSETWAEDNVTVFSGDEIKAGERIDRFLTEAMDQTRSFIVKLIEKYGADAGKHIYDYVKKMVDSI